MTEGPLVLFELAEIVICEKIFASLFFLQSGRREQHKGLFASGSTDIGNLMKHLVRLWLCIALCLCTILGWARGDELLIGTGYGKQSGNPLVSQNNAVIDVIYDFYGTRWKEWGLSLGAGASWLWNDQDKHEVFITSLVPTLRWYFQESDSLRPYLFASTGFAYMTEPRLGGQVLGGYFAFNDFFGLGTYCGHELKWNVSVCWRHISNAGLFDPNDGIDIPLCVMVGRTF